MMIKFMEVADECGDVVTWPEVAVFAIIVAGLVTWVWIVNR